MTDFAKWTRGASIFLRGLTHLPGQLDIDDAIEPPADDYDRKWLASDTCSLPSEVRLFLSSASRRCCFHYQWWPPSDYRGQLSALFPNHATLIGGGDLCEAARYSTYENRDGLPDCLGASMFGLATCFKRMEAELDRGRLTLMDLPDGDAISLQLTVLDGMRPVVYVAADKTTKPLVLSTSFEQFLLDWQRLSYIQPTLTFLAPWIDAGSGRLDPDHGPTDALSKLLIEPLT